MTKLFAAVACLVVLAVPPLARAQGVPGGAEHGYHEGDRIAGPLGGIVGAAVGGLIGGVVGGVNGVLGVRPGDDDKRAPAHHRRDRRYRNERDDR